MVITNITKGKGKKYRVYGEDGYLFSLYGKELKRYHIMEQADVDDFIISSIMDEIIYKRAKERALYLLESRPMTEKMIRDKLKMNEYPDGIISRVIVFLYQYHYLDDMAYIELYIQTYASKKSKKQMVLDLQKRGISKDNLDVFFESNSYSDEMSFQKQFHKYIQGKDLSDFKVRQKVFRYFYGKGYDSSVIEDGIRHKMETM